MLVVGRLLYLAPCPVCNYYVEGPLHFGGSNRSRLFIRHRYLLAECHDCRHIVSVLVPTPDHDLPHVLQAAQDDLAALEKRAAQGDALARRLLPLHRFALQPAADEEAIELDVGVCTVCGSRNLTVFAHVGGDEGERFDQSLAWLDCPRCEEGRLLVQTGGYWDEIDEE